ncbi:MAG: class I SAM-dependent methyltransferase [Candidatus Bathyarchaeota archaeon]|nr:class I SAM-dependent methyltransferase [Candidatus Bathyarchaeota archaeon]
MRDNVKYFLQLLTQVFDIPAPVVEIGALQAEGQESYADVRPLFGERLYIGCDMRTGPGVDCLIDAHRLPFRDGSVATVLLLDTLEHCQSPFTAVQEACRVLRRDGVLVLASVMNFPIHSYPSDYWRFTPAVFDYLLCGLDTRSVFSQGDAEFPHTVIGLGTPASSVGEAGEAFRAAVQEIQTRWSEMMHGGPLLPWHPSAVALAQRVADRRLPELERRRTIAQSLVCPVNNMSRIDVKMSNFQRVNPCHVQFGLCQEGEPQQEIAAYRLSALHVMDEAWTSIPVPVQAESAGRRYLLTLESPDGVPGQAVTAMASNRTAYEEGQLSIDGEPVEGSLCFQVYCRSPHEAVSGAARGESPRAADARAGGPSADTSAERLTANDIAALILRAEEQRWEQTRYLASVIGSGFDGIQAELKAAEARLEGIQRQALEQSTEAAALVRSIRRNPLYRVWKRFFG